MKQCKEIFFDEDNTQSLDLHLALREKSNQLAKEILKIFHYKGQISLCFILISKEVNEQQSFRQKSSSLLVSLSG